MPIPPAFGDAVGRLGGQVATWTALLKEPAQTLGLSATDFARWLSRATAAIAEAEALLQALEG